MRHSVFIAALVAGLLGVVHSTLAIHRISVIQVQASFVGEEVGDWADWVACVGDVNSDGFDDFLIGAWFNDYGGKDVGQTYLILGRTTGWSLRTSLSEADASFIGEIEGAYVGIEISGAGDVNGDGYDDILIGSSNFYYRNEEPRGQTYLIFGKAGGRQMRTNLSGADASFIGENPGDRSGAWVACAGDVNGDGYDDILIGAAFNSFSGDQAGQAYLFFGKPDGWRMRTKLSLADASFAGEHQGNWSGYPVAGAGDVNCDGYDDILIASHQSENRVGQTYLIFGQPDGWSMRTPLSEADASFIGEEENDRAGYCVSGAGDVNGDGYDDFLIGAQGNNYAGKHAGQVYLILGKPDGWSMRTPLSQADASFIGEGEVNIACNVSVAGDVNGDGYDDILIGAPGYDNYTGQTYLILGRSEGWKMRMSLSEADVSFIGEDSLDWSGESLSGAGDVNGDGHDDILIGAFNDSYGAEDPGRVYLCLHIPVTITTRTLKSGAVGVPYSEEFSATGGTPPYIWNLHSGLLPDGMRLDSTGVISGVPTSLDTADFTVKVTDAVSDTNTKGFTIRIRETAKGDVNGDGQVNILDVVFAVNIILGLYDPTPTQFWAADCDNDSVVNVQDIICMVSIILEGGEGR